MFSCEYCKTSKSNYFEEYLRTAASEVTLRSECLGLPFWTGQSLLNQSFKHNLAHMHSLNLTPTFSFEPSFLYAPLTVTTEKANA